MSLHRKHRGHATERCVLNYVVISREVVWVKEAINSPLVLFCFFAKERETNGGGGWSKTRNSRDVDREVSDYT